VGNTVTKPLTIEEFERLGLPEVHARERHNGELVGVPFPAVSADEILRGIAIR